MDEQLRTLISETAARVRTEGKDFLESLLASSSEKYGFIHPDNPYHKYYLSMLNGDEIDSIIATVTVPPAFTYSNYDRTGIIPSEDLNIIKKTAEFFVISTQRKEEFESKSFLKDLKDSLLEDKHFLFLQDDHDLNPIFNDFVTQYKKVLLNNQSSMTQDEYLRQCFDRATYNEYATQLQKEHKEIRDLYKIRFAAINWLKFHTLPKIAVTLQNADKVEQNGEKITKYKEPLDFNKITERKILKSEISKYLDEYFQEQKTLSPESTTEATIITNPPSKTKKRKGKMLIKGKGETRINKKRK